jgi:hypothetical protein
VNLPHDDHKFRAKIRKHAVNDVLTGRLSIVGAALVWDVRRDDLQRWVDEARANRQDES